MLKGATIVFDLDGTLVDTAPDLTHELNHVLTRRGHGPVSAAAVQAGIGLGIRVMIEETLRRLGATEDLDEMLGNLLDNACKWARVRVVVTAQPTGDQIAIAVEDDGPGIDPADVDRIFKPLFTTKEHGMGMGLSICRSIVESHNGRIWVSADRERGTVFQVFLPTNRSGM